jgi:hypothetical protein
MPNQLQYTDLANEANDFMTGQALKPFQANLPQYATNVAQRSQNTNQMLKGQLPQDVINQISQQAAERGIATGSPGSNNANAAYLRALGLNSLGMMGQGSQELSRSIADTPVPQLWNPLSLQIPQTLAAQELAQARAGQAQQGQRNAPQGGPITPPLALGGGGFNSGSFTGGVWNGNPGMTSVGGPAWGGITPQGGYNAAANNWMGGGQMQQPNYGGTQDFDPLSHTFAQGGQYGGSVDWANLYQDPNMPAGWADQDWGGPFNQINASNPDNAFMFE